MQKTSKHEGTIHSPMQACRLQSWLDFCSVPRLSLNPRWLSCCCNSQHRPRHDTEEHIRNRFKRNANLHNVTNGSQWPRWRGWDTMEGHDDGAKLAHEHRLDLSPEINRSGLCDPPITWSEPTGAYVGVHTIICSGFVANFGYSCEFFHASR